MMPTDPAWKPPIAPRWDPPGPDYDPAKITLLRRLRIDLSDHDADILIVGLDLSEGQMIVTCEIRHRDSHMWDVSDWMRKWIQMGERWMSEAGRAGQDWSWADLNSDAAPSR